MKPILFLATVVSATLMVATSCSEQKAPQEPLPSSGPAIWNLANIDAKAKRINAGEKIEFYENLKHQADSILKVELNPSVMHKIADPHPSSGTKHDYMSMSRYTWPNPNTDDGKPYIFRDGRSNPELNNYDRRILSSMSGSVNTLSLVYYISGDQRYADKAISRLRTWFTDEETLMNPNFAYGQIYKGYNDDKGMPPGLLDGLSFVEMLDAVSLLEIKGVVPRSLQDSMRTWFTEMTDWMITSELGILESNVEHNHAVAYDTQIIRYAMFTGDTELAKKIVNEFPKRRLDEQIAADGRMPNELIRSISFMYTNYNLGHMIDICDMAKKLDIDLYPASNRAIERAISWIQPYSIDSSSYPYQQIKSWVAVRESFAKTLFRAAPYGKTEEYNAYYEKYKAEKENPMFEFLYL